ncbi:hypothetical protein V9L16_00185 [Pseudomonas tolaasii]|uniref:hypothetical protein n=1 Tax=Pseudomonas tolaasii TaxID=29442 RepID=UPI0030D3B51B
MDTIQFKALLSTITREFWDINHRPLLLSNLPVEFKKNKVDDYSAILEGETLKSFVGRTSGDTSYSVITHPVHRAKIGLIPPGETYQYQAEVETPPVNSPAGALEQPNDAIALLEILSRLPKEELEKIVLPVSVLAKLYKKP